MPKNYPSPSRASVNHGVPAEVLLTLTKQAELRSRCNCFFEEDSSINSRYPPLSGDSIRDERLRKYKCAHCIGGANRTPSDGGIREVFNITSSQCSSLGSIKTGEHYISNNVGHAGRFNGLSLTNPNTRRRGVVLHGGAYASAHEAGTDTSICGRSWGRRVVDDRYTDFEGGRELIECLTDDSICVANYPGHFTIPD